MCNIMVCYRIPTEEELTASWQSNNHGAGVAWNNGEKVYYKKGIMKIEDLKKIIEKIKPPYVIHFRLASIGAKIPELTHPFVISKEISNPLQYEGEHSVLFHNGTEREAVNMFMMYCLLKNKKIPEHFSDSLCIAKLVCVLGYNYLRHLDGKFCIVEPKKIITFGSFQEDNGIFHSCKPFTFYRNATSENCPYSSNFSLCTFPSYRSCKYIYSKCPKKNF